MFPFRALVFATSMVVLLTWIVMPLLTRGLQRWLHPKANQSLLDSGKFKGRAELARFLGVSRARVTQVLNRLKPPLNTSEPSSASGDRASDVA